MTSYYGEGCRREAMYMLKYQCTIRQAAKVFNISKSKLHADVSKRLPQIDKELYMELKKLLDKNSKEKHIRGGMTTQMRYSKKVKA